MPLNQRNPFSRKAMATPNTISMLTAKTAKVTVRRAACQKNLSFSAKR